MHEPRLRPDVFGKMRQKGDDVMLGFGFDRVDPRNIELGRGTLFPDNVSGFLRYGAKVGHRTRGMRFDLEPDPEARFRAPDVSHFGTGIARDHIMLDG